MAVDTIHANVHTHSHIHVGKRPCSRHGTLFRAGGVLWRCRRWGVAVSKRVAVHIVSMGILAFPFASFEIHFTFSQASPGLSALEPKEICSAGAGGFAAGTDGQPKWQWHCHRHWCCSGRPDHAGEAGLASGHGAPAVEGGDERRNVWSRARSWGQYWTQCSSCAAEWFWAAPEHCCQAEVASISTQQKCRTGIPVQLARKHVFT